MSNKNEWAHRGQLVTKPVAEKHGETWTSADLEFLTAFQAEISTDVALALGRTLYSVQSMRKLVAEGRTAARRVAASDRPYRGWKISDGDE